MKSITGFIPTTLQREHKILVEKCDLLIEAFNQLCNEENNRLKEEKQVRLASRTFNYSIKEIGEGWRVLYREASELVGESDEKVWSKPFKIINGVLIHRENSHENTSYVTATRLIPQGLFDETTLETINIGW